MAKSMLTIKEEAMAMAKDLGAKVDGTVLMDIIRKTRAKSDIALQDRKSVV